MPPTRRAIAIALVATAFTSTAATAEDRKERRMTEIVRMSELKTVVGAPENFSGHVTITGQFQHDDPSRSANSIPAHATPDAAISSGRR